MTESWALKAIEDEAMRRASRELVANADKYTTVYGLTMGQIAYLKQKYERETGREASTCPSYGLTP